MMQLREKFTIVFYGLRIFCCKTAQSCEMPCEPASLWSALKNTAAQRPERLRKKPSLNYESRALPLSYRPAFAWKITIGRYLHNDETPPKCIRTVAEQCLSA
jgi:hypothetical protein